MDERELIRKIRAELVRACSCDAEDLEDDEKEVCGSCVLVNMIDNGLVEIARDRAATPK